MASASFSASSRLNSLSIVRSTVWSARARVPVAARQRRAPVRRLSLSIRRLHATPLDAGARSVTNTGAPSDEALDSKASSSGPAPSDSPSVVMDHGQGKIGVTWNSGIESRFHNVWLRDHCRCAACYHPKTKQRQIDTFAIPLDVKPHAVESTIEGLLVHWPRMGVSAEVDAAMAKAPSAEAGAQIDNAHISLYPWSWLYANSYAPTLSLGSASHTSRNMVLWGSGIAQQPPTVTYDEVMSSESDLGVARWVNKISQFGFCFVSGVPPMPEATEQLVRRIAFVRETHYGAFWDFTSDLSHGDTAYTNLALGAHTDTTYFTDPAGLQLFHLLSHTAAQKDATPASGGESLLVDGFFAAKILRDVYPDAYHILSHIRISTHSAGDDTTLIRPLQSAGHSVLEHDERTGELIRVRYNNDDRSVLRVRDEDVVPLYDALNKWHGILTHADSEYRAQLLPGMPMIFDNNRVLHGRSAFTGNRRLCGAYVNHDDYRSRLAVLQRQFPDMGSSGVRRSGASGSSEALPTTRTVRRGVWDDGI